jgi:hypothetical protein
MASSDRIQYLPAIPSELTPEWLGSKLGHKIKSVENTRNIWGTGSKLYYTITYADESTEPRPAYVCIKGIFDPAMVATQPWTVAHAQLNADFFTRLAPQIKNMIFPKGWWSGASDKQGIAIMSDLYHEGCTFPPEVASYSVEQVMNGVEQLAGLHAEYWGRTQEDHPCKLTMHLPGRFLPSWDETGQCMA